MKFLSLFVALFASALATEGHAQDGEVLNTCYLTYECIKPTRVEPGVPPADWWITEKVECRAVRVKYSGVEGESKMLPVKEYPINAVDLVNGTLDECNAIRKANFADHVQLMRGG